MKKRILSILLIFSVIIGVCPVAFAAAPLLPHSFTSLEAKVGASSPFKPMHKYACMQNPPDFTWPQIEDAYSYDIKVCSDEALTKTVYTQNDIRYSYYNFTYPFASGTYWWAVRYRKTAKGEASSWSVARRFRVSHDASTYIVPDFRDVAASIPRTHPRIWFTQDSIDEFIAQKDTVEGNNIYRNIIGITQAHMNQQFEQDTNLITSVVTSRATNLGYRAQNAALAYILTDNPEEKKKYGDYAVAALLHAASWGYELNEKGPDGKLVYVNGSARNGNDQAFFELLLRTSMAYDWMYNYMVEEGREEDIVTIRNMLVGRFETIKDYQLDLLRKEPYNSHFWSYFGYYGMTCLALIHDINGVDEYLAQMLELYSAQLPPMSVEDGGWSKGTAYWTYAFTRDKWFMDAMKYAGYIDYYDKAWARNELKWALYMFPDNSWGSFGDESGSSKAGTNHIMGLTKLGKFTDNPVAYWLRNKIGSIGSANTGTFDAIMYADTASEKGEAPYDYPKAHLFVDQGMVGMHSSLINSERTSMYFRSGKYGSYNHMHADQNAFFIEHNGNKLATKSGFYDSYHSVHDSGFTRQTFAHNTVTYNGGNGQKDDSMDANGNIEQFVTHHDFDAVVGNGTNAYVGNIGLFKRSIIYLRPQSYIVVDNLSGGNYIRYFEWWLNSPHGTMTVDGKKAKVVNNGSQLDVDVIYPYDIGDGVFMQNYINPADGKEYYPDTTTGKVSEAKAALAPDRAYFKTKAVSETSIITTMSVSEGSPLTFTQTSGNGYIKLVPNGDDEHTVIYIRTANSGSVTTTEGYIFDATAIVVSDNTFMMVNGQSLSFGGSVIERTSVPVTFVIGKGQMSLSADDDVSVKIYKNGFLKKYFPLNFSTDNMKDASGRKMEAYVKDTHSPTGIMISSRNTYITIYADKGHYMYLTEPYAFVSADQMIPKDVSTAFTKDGKMILSWKCDLPGAMFDAEIDGEIHRNVTSPYTVDISGKSFCTVRLRGKNYNVESEWTDSVVCYSNLTPYTSHIEFIVNGNIWNGGVLKAGDSICAKAHLNNAQNDETSFILAQYSSDGSFVDMTRNVYPGSSDKHREIVVGPALAKEDGNYFKAYTVNSSNLAPSGKAGTSVIKPRLDGITADGVQLVDFKSDKYTYTVATPSDGTLPVIKGVSSNGALYITTAYSVANDAKSAVAKISVEAGEESVGEYTVNVVPGQGASRITPFVKNFTQLVGGMTYYEYCDYVESVLGVNPYENATTASMSRKAPANYRVRQFKVGEALTGSNTQRKITSLDKKFGWENLYFIASDPAMSQAPYNTPAWVQAAYYGTIDAEEIIDTNGNLTGENYVYNLDKYSVPWFEFELTRDAEIIQLSFTPIAAYENDKSWKYTYLETAPYTAMRTDTLGVTSAVDACRHIYTKDFKKGDKVQLYNQGGDVRPVFGYITLVNLK